MTSMPASRRARAMILAPRSWPSRPGFATTTRIFFVLLLGAGSVIGAPAGRRIIFGRRNRDVLGPGSTPRCRARRARDGAGDEDGERPLGACRAPHRRQRPAV